MRNCTFYLRSSDTPANPQQIKKHIIQGQVQQKIAAVKQLIKAIIVDESFPHMIMNMIQSIIPIIHSSPQVRKVMLLYWQVIEKNKSVNDKNLKDEMFLACNSLRNDLLSHNQYLRGRTLRLVSRIMHKGVIQPLSSAITQNLQHKSSYVRRNAVVCLYQVYVHFGSDIIGDIDEEIEKLLKNETDLSTKRNAFLLLYKTNPQKAMQYIQAQVNNQTLQELGDILKLAILKVFKVTCKEDASQKPKLLRIIKSFSVNASESVSLECAITSTAISNNVSTIKGSLYSYVSILAKTNELNVKKIILDKLAIICKNTSYLEDDLIEDLLKSLETPSLQIKQKLLQIIILGATLKTSHIILKELEKQIKHHDESQYIDQIVRAVEYMGLKYDSIHDPILNFVVEKIFKLPKLGSFSALSVVNVLKHIMVESGRQKSGKIRESIVDKFSSLQSPELIRAVLNLLGSCLDQPQLIIKAINVIGVTIGSLPIQSPRGQQSIKEQGVNSDFSGNKTVQQKKAKKVFKTVILQDGSYATQLIEVQNDDQQKNQNEKTKEQIKMVFRNQLAKDSIMGATFARNIGKLLYKIRQSQFFTKYACSILMILCSLLRNYNSKVHQVDQACIDQITFLIRKITNPKSFIQQKDQILEDSGKVTVRKLGIFGQLQREKQSQVIERNPEDMIVFRQLKKGGNQQIDEIDFEDQQINDFMENVTEQTDYISRLKSIVQLTGYFDPLYAQSFVKINKYDVFFEIILVNTSKSNLLNIQVQFASSTEIMVLEKAQSVNLRPGEMVKLRSHIRFLTEFGSVYGYINYDNQAGLEQPYLITQEINMDFMQFIVPAQISEFQFKNQWVKANFETKVQKKLDFPDLTFKKIISKCEKSLHVYAVQKYQATQEEYFLNIQFYGKSKLAEDFMLNIALFKGEGVDLNCTIKSKDKAVIDIIKKQLQKMKFNDEEIEN